VRNEVVFRRLWSAWASQREARAVARRPIPDDLWKRTLVRYPFLRRRDPGAAAELRRLASLFLDRKEFSPAGGLKLTNQIVVAIAAQACLPVLRLGLGRYDGFVGVVVHPDQVLARREVADEAGVVHTYDEVLSGEALQGGPVMLSWRDVRGAGSGDIAYNVVIHEFAHVLDMEDGVADGVPRLPRELGRDEWLSVLSGEYESFTRRVEAAEPTTLDAYGAQSIDEFFAVASEGFFVMPRRTRAEQPALYALLARFYRQDPAAENP
jgi:Mlc titration factor MtfA (ptsG expression regulator)